MAVWLHPYLHGLGKRWRLAARIRLANIKARKHPKRTFGLVVGCLLLVFVFDVSMNFRSHEQQTMLGESPMSDIAQMDPLFEGFRHIQANKAVQQNELQAMAAEGKALHAQLDSLLALPKKTHRDSLRIVSGYHRLETIVKSLKYNDTHD
jgi:hypothetical protein